MPGVVPEGDPPAGEHLLALGALGGYLVLEALDAVDVAGVGDDERLRSDLQQICKERC